MENNMSKHTPGPWKAVQYGAPILIQNESSDVEICSIKGSGFAKTPNNQRLFNAYLIAAAPDMIYVLKYAKERIEFLISSGLRDRGIEFVLADIEHVLKKAEGKTT